MKNLIMLLVVFSSSTASAQYFEPQNIPLSFVATTSVSADETISTIPEAFTLHNAGLFSDDFVFYSDIRALRPFGVYECTLNFDGYAETFEIKTLVQHDREYIRFGKIVKPLNFVADCLSTSGDVTFDLVFY